MARYGRQLKIWQVNLDRTMQTFSELRKVAAESGIDLLLLQEPPAVRRNIGGFGPANVVLTGAEREERPWAAVVVLNRSISLLRIGHLSTSYTVYVELTTHLGPLVVVSCYMRHSVPKEVFVRELRIIADSSVFIGMDANSNSSLWGSPITDRN